MTDQMLRDDVLPAVSRGQVAPDNVLSALTRDDLTRFLSPAFDDLSGATPIGSGRGVLPGDVSGILVLHRTVADRMIQHAGRTAFPLEYIYSIPEGSIEDFQAIKHSCGFFTSNAGRTTWSVVQAVSEGVPTVIAVPCEYCEDPAVTRRVTFPLADGSSLQVQLPRRFLRFTDPDGRIQEVEEGDVISFSGHTGRIYPGRIHATPSTIHRVFALLLESYAEAVDRFGYREAWDRLTETSTFNRVKGELFRLINLPAFHGFQILKRHALKRTDLKVFVTAHTPLGVARARLLASDITFDQDGLRIVTESEDYGIGLLRDERMWATPEQIHLLRLLLLGPDAIGQKRFRSVGHSYLVQHAENLYRVLAAGTGSAAVVRTLCMPYNKIFPDDFDSAEFARLHGLPHGPVAKALASMSGERETYHGCRGMRVFCQRPDIAALWLTAVLRAVKRVHDEGIPVRVRILLAMITLPEEGRMFLDLFDRLAPNILGDALPEVIEGVSCMLETSAAYLALEELFGQAGRSAAINGGLIGSNDFTAACLNFNRADSVRNIVPGYIARGVLTDSPFHRIHEAVVGKAILLALRRTRLLSRRLSRPYCWGLGGELAGDWETVQWLAKRAAPAGLHHVTTAPENVLPALFAAAQVAAGARPLPYPTRTSWARGRLLAARAIDDELSLEPAS